MERQRGRQVAIETTMRWKTGIVDCKRVAGPGGGCGVVERGKFKVTCTPARLCYPYIAIPD
jgi:hypothetical protein